MRTPGSISHLLYPLKKRWYIVLLCISISMVLATRYVNLAKQKFQSAATIKIEDAQGVSNSNLYKDFDVFKSNVKVQTEVEVLKSRSLFERALDKLDFYVEYYVHNDLKTNEVYQSNPFLVDFSVTDVNFSEKHYKFDYLGGNKFSVTSSTKGIESQKIGFFGKPLCDNGICLTINKNVSVLNSKPTNYIHQQWSFTIFSKNALSTKLMTKDYIVKTVDKDANIIRIYYAHEIAAKSSKMVNAIAEAYIEQNILDKHEIAGNTVDFINQQLIVVGKELDNARNAIKTYRIEHNIVNINQETEATYRTLGQLEIQNVDLNMKLAALENLSDYLRLNKEIKFTGPALENIQDGLFNESIARLNTKYRERSETLKKYTEESDYIKNIDVDIAQQKSYLVESINNTRRKLLASQDELFVAIDDEKSTFNGLPEKESTLTELNRNYNLYEKVYNFLIEKRAEAMIISQVDVSFNKVLEFAVTPSIAMSPNKFVILGIAAILGLAIGIALAYLRHYMKPTVNAPEDIALNSNIPVIGHLEISNKNNPAYKSFTALTTRILMNDQQMNQKIISITSTKKGEGKSYVAAQLARTFAAQDKRVLLIDANTYAPVLNNWFDARGTVGLSDIYSNASSIHDAIQITNIPQLDIITSGDPSTPISHLIPTQKTKVILEELSDTYDTIIIDTPEVGEYVDAIPFMKWSDLNLYIVKANDGRTELIANAELVKEEYRLEQVHFVINGMQEPRNHTGYVSHKKIKPLQKKTYLPRLANLFVW